MGTARTKIFRSNRSQLVRLPKAVALSDSIKEVDIIAIGNQRLITPPGGIWDPWFDGSAATDDFMSEPEQPAPQKREGCRL